jgi:hypothetical protein
MKRIFLMKNIFFGFFLSIILLAPNQAGAEAEAPDGLSQPYGWWQPAPNGRMGGAVAAPAGAASNLANQPEKASQTASIDNSAGHPQATAGAAHTQSNQPEKASQAVSMDNSTGHPQANAGTAHNQANQPDKASQAASMGNSAGHAPTPAGGSMSASQSPKPAFKTSNAESNSHSFTMNRSPIHKIYLNVRGAAQPAEAPEVYYVFTKRTLERHGGVPLEKTVHKAEVVLDNNVWRADIYNVSFGTAEVMSRFKLGDTTVYSQYNFLHFLTPELAEGLEPPETAVLPTDWPSLSFPEGSYNGMPFRGLQTGRTAEFTIKKLGTKNAMTAYLIDPRPEGMPPAPIVHNPSRNDYTIEASEDPTLVVVRSGPMGGISRSKTSVAVVEISGAKEVLTFTLNVTLSRWSYRKINYGLGLAAVAGLGTTVIVRRKRKKFKFNNLGLPEEETKD